VGSNHEMASLTDREGGSWLRRGLGLPRPPHLIREGTSCVGRCWGRIGFRESGRARGSIGLIGSWWVGLDFSRASWEVKCGGRMEFGVWAEIFGERREEGKCCGRTRAGFFLFSFSRMQVWLSWAVWFPSQVLGQASVHFLGCSA